MNLSEFTKWAIENSAFEGCDLNGADVQDKAVACGILEKTKYDPKKHGSSIDCCEPGDDWYVFTKEFCAAARKP